MKRRFKHAYRCGLALALAVPLTIALAACSSTAPSATAQAPVPPSVAAPTQSGAPKAPPRGLSSPGASSTVPAPGSSQRQGTNGTLTKIDGDTLTLTTQQGPVIVNVSSNTAIQKAVVGSLSDLQTGQLLTVTGAADASGNIAASSIAVRPQRQNPGVTPPVRTAPNPSRTPNGPSTGTNPAPANGALGGGPLRGARNGTLGTLTKIDGNTLTLTTGQGQLVTVTVGSSTTLQKTVTGNLSGLQVNQSLTVTGTRDAAGNIGAVSIMIGQ